jgi:hypothetical protein
MGHLLTAADALSDVVWPKISDRTVYKLKDRSDDTGNDPLNCKYCIGSFKSF